jgi:hypothetical protein
VRTPGGILVDASAAGNVALRRPRWYRAKLIRGKPHPGRTGFYFGNPIRGVLVLNFSQPCSVPSVVTNDGVISVGALGFFPGQDE